MLLRMEATRSCLFCGGRPVTKEHVLPTWVYDTLGVVGPMTHVHGARPTRVARVFDIVLRAVCTSCNNGWLSSIEGHARNVIGPAMAGERVEWNAEEQKLATVWAIKTALLLELAERHLRGAGIAPAEHFAHLFATREPPPGSMCWMAAVDAKGKDILWSRVTTVDPLEGPPARGYFATVAVGYLVLHVFGWVWDASHAGERPTVSPVVPAHLRPALVRLWPIEMAIVRFPPGPYFDGHQQLGLLHQTS